MTTVQTEHSPRKRAYTMIRLGTLAKRLQEQAKRAAALAGEMEDAELVEIPVDGHAMLQRGLSQVDDFLDNASRALRETKNDKHSI